MNTDTKEDVDQDKVKALFKIFQQQRELAPQERQQTIMEKVHSGKTTGLIHAETEGEQAVVDQYQKFMRERDRSREEVIARVTAYAKSKSRTETVKQGSLVKTAVSDRHLSGLFQWPGHALHRIIDWISMAFPAGAARWRLALPVLAMAAVALWVVPTIKHSTDDLQIAAWNNFLPARMAKNAGNILRKLEPATQPTLGFTQRGGTFSAGFELGQAMAYIELALAARSEKHILNMVKRADRLAKELNLPLLSAQYDLQEDAVSLNRIAQRWFGENNELTTYYQLGYWMETTRFAMQLTEFAKGLEPINEQLTLLKERRSVWERKLQQHPIQLRQFLKLADLDPASLETHYGRQMFARQLERTIAVFKNL